MLGRGHEAVCLGVHNLDRLEVGLSLGLLDLAEVEKHFVSLRDHLVKPTLILELPG